MGNCLCQPLQRPLCKHCGRRAEAPWWALDAEQQSRWSLGADGAAACKACLISRYSAEWREASVHKTPSQCTPARPTVTPLALHAVSDCQPLPPAATSLQRSSTSALCYSYRSPLASPASLGRISVPHLPIASPPAASPPSLGRLSAPHLQLPSAAAGSTDLVLRSAFSSDLAAAQRPLSQRRLSAGAGSSSTSSSPRLWRCSAGPQLPPTPGSQHRSLGRLSCGPPDLPDYSSEAASSSAASGTGGTGTLPSRSSAVQLAARSHSLSRQSSSLASGVSGWGAGELCEYAVGAQAQASVGSGSGGERPGRSRRMPSWGSEGEAAQQMGAWVEGYATTAALLMGGRGHHHR